MSVVSKMIAFRNLHLCLISLVGLFPQTTKPLSFSNCHYDGFAYSDCSTTCGPGFRSKSPKILREALEGGKACPENETEICNSGPCPPSCTYEWTEWSSCSRGRRTRTWIAGSMEMEECPEERETEECQVEDQGQFMYSHPAMMSSTQIEISRVALEPQFELCL